MSRPSWDLIWIKFAQSIAARSVDPRTKVGAVIVTDDNTQVLAVGYNGDHKGGPNAIESVIPGESGLIHAEINALIKCDYNSHQKKIMYVTVSPCILCSKAIINAGISKIVYCNEYRDSTGVKFLKQEGLEVVKFDV